MKKLLYVAALAILTIGSFTSCTEEEVKPQVEETNNNGGKPIKE